MIAKLEKLSVPTDIRKLLRTEKEILQLEQAAFQTAHPLGQILSSSTSCNLNLSRILELTIKRNGVTELQYWKSLDIQTIYDK